MTENNREVDQATAALTTELLKLSPLQGVEKTTLSVTIENAISRLTAAIIEQSRNPTECFPAEPVPVG